MAMRTLYATKDMRDPLYRTRMLKAGQPIELSGPDARLYLHLGVATDKKPARAQAPAAETETKAETPIAAPKKPARKRAARRKK